LVCTKPTAFSSQSLMTLAPAAATGTVSNSPEKSHARVLNIAASLIALSGFVLLAGNAAAPHWKQRLPPDPAKSTTFWSGFYDPWL
jgi:hypothetical protein